MNGNKSFLNLNHAFYPKTQHLNFYNLIFVAAFVSCHVCCGMSTLKHVSLQSSVPEVGYTNCDNLLTT